MEKVVEYSELENDFIDNELEEYITNNFTPLTVFNIRRLIRTFDLLGYGDYALDVYNFINLDHSNIYQPEANLLFMELLISHTIKLLESIGIKIEDSDLVNESYSEHFNFFVNILECVYFLKTMSDIDALYFSDLFNNDYLDKFEIMYRIFSYYIPDLNVDEYYKLIKDYTGTFLNVLKDMVVKLANETDTSYLNYDDVDTDKLLLVYEFVNNFYDDYKSSIVLNSMITDLMYTDSLFNKSGFNSELTKIRKLLIDSLKEINYHAFTAIIPTIRGYLFDIFTLNLYNNIRFLKNSIEESINNSKDDTLIFISTTELPGQREMLKIVNEVYDKYKTVLTDDRNKNLLYQVFEIERNLDE